MAGAAIGAFAVAVYGAVQLGMSGWGSQFMFADLGGYLAGAKRFLVAGSPYDPATVAGPWALQPHSFIHPPVALALFLPFVVLPAVLWWGLPLGFTAWAVWRLKPPPWTWPVMSLCLAWPRSAGSLLAGNTDMWAMAFVGAGAVAGWPLALLVIKPTFAPVALIGSTRRSMWIAGVIAATGSLLFLPLWVEYFSVIRNSGLGLDYSLLNLPLVLLPVVAWAGSRRRGPRSLLPSVFAQR